MTDGAVRRRQNSAYEPSAWRQIGCPRSCPSFAACSTARSSTSMPIPGPVASRTNQSRFRRWSGKKEVEELVAEVRDRLLLDQDVRRREVDLQRRRERDWTQRTVGGDHGASTSAIEAIRRVSRFRRPARRRAGLGEARLELVSEVPPVVDPLARPRSGGWSLSWCASIFICSGSTGSSTNSSSYGSSWGRSRVPLPSTNGRAHRVQCRGGSDCFTKCGDPGNDSWPACGVSTANDLAGVSLKALKPCSFAPCLCDDFRFAEFAEVIAGDPASARTRSRTAPEQLVHGHAVELARRCPRAPCPQLRARSRGSTRHGRSPSCA